MALLTKEQIQDLYLQLDNVSSTSVMQKVIQEWNEKQTTQQIEPDWSKASDGAVSAVVHVTWVNKLGTWLGSNPVVIFERPASVITPHPHAEIMAKYAEIAACRTDPWIEFQYTCATNNWLKLKDHPTWDESIKYRHIGDNK